jgi:predicted NBD/HSP70 family sugar kinase
MTTEDGIIFSDLYAPDVLAAFMRDHRQLNPESSLLSCADMKYEDIFEAAGNEDPLAIALSQKLGRSYAKLLRNINIVFDAEQVYLLGALAKADNHFLSALKEDLSTFVYYDEIPGIFLDSSPLDEMIVKGSASNFLDQFYKESSIYLD